MKTKFKTVLCVLLGFVIATISYGCSSKVTPYDTNDAENQNHQLNWWFAQPL